MFEIGIKIINFCCCFL